FHEGKLFESTGAPEDLPQARSLFGIVNMDNGQIEVKAELDKSRYFGEGIAVLGGKVYQLTYQTREGFIYDAASFKEVGRFSNPGKEGWGMTTDGKQLIMSEGTNRLLYLDPATMGVSRTLQVTDDRGDVNFLNELEFINGYIYANVYGTPLIVRIDPATGKVTGRMDMSNLMAAARNQYPGSMEMNGIAWNEATKRLYITGKMWPYIFELSMQ
ncbi:MAG: glutaminyl-peptide cyclotransferase, partial [Sphingobacteriales bacterium]